MSSVDRHRETGIRRLAEASVWRVRLSEADLESSADFEAWLASDPANPRAWTRIQSQWMAASDSATSPEVIAARRDALHRARQAARRRWSGNHLTWVLGAAAVVAGIGLAVVMLLLGTGVQQFQYRTSLGQHRKFVLPDGSQVLLDAGTALDVRYSRRSREIRLLKGQARFAVAHNSARPFTVHAGGQAVVAVGTDFNVDLIGPTVRVILIKGRVMVAPDHRSHNAAVMLLPGQQLVASPSHPPQIALANIRSATAWQEGLLIFDNQRLGSVVTIISRYSERPIRADTQVCNLKVSGVFKEGDIATFLDVITHYLPVSATDGPDNAIVLRSTR